MIIAPLAQAASSAPTRISALESSISALEEFISALESDIARLESSLPWEYWVYVFTALVVVGVVMELWVIRHDWRDEMETWALSHFGVLRSPDRPSVTKLIVELCSVVLIAVGVAGELGVGVRIAYVDGRIRAKGIELRSRNAELRSKSNELLALVTQQAGTAEQSAKDAHDLGVELTAKYGAAEKEIIELKAAKLHRRLSSKQKAIFRRAVISFTGTSLGISCAVPGGDASESLDFEQDFLAAVGITPSNWTANVPVHVGFLTSCSSIVGGSVFIPPIQVEVGADRTSDGEILLKALAEMGIDKKQIRKKVNDNAPERMYLTLTVGPKPE